MKKLTAALSSAGILMAMLGSGSAMAYSDQVMEASESYDTEPPRDCRRLNILREYNDENTTLHPRD